MAIQNAPIENRFHITVYDAGGTAIPLDNLTRQEMDEFRAAHEDDGLEYKITHGVYRPVPSHT